MSPENYRAVLFDFFGTLTRAVSRGPSHALIARRLGCAPDAFNRVLNETFYQRSVGALGDPATALGMVAARLGSYPSRSMLESVLADRVDAVAADTRLRAEAVPLLRALKRSGYATGLISDCGPELPVFLSDLPLAPLLDTSVLSIQIGRHKPDPAVYLTACARLGVSPSRCLYVGDGGSHELTGASAVGMTAVRLDAPDLVGHLAFASDTGWPGWRIRCLTGVLDVLESVQPLEVAA